jgi:dTMP kinase
MLFIAIEGLDRVGKTTLAQSLAESLRKVTPVTLTREPGAIPAIRDMIADRSIPLTPKAIFFLFCADRAQHVEEVICPALASGNLVITDRFFASSIAYQGWGEGLAMTKGMPEAIAYSIEPGKRTSPSITPDLWIWIEGTPFGDANGDRYENKDSNFEKAVAMGYESIFTGKRRPEFQRVLRLATTMPPAIMLAESLKTIAAITGNEKFYSLIPSDASE